jgi:uncharacterized membrane protein YbhN (UPF0104 family)
MSSQYKKAAASLTIVVLTIAAFIYFFAKHPEVSRQLSRLNPGIILLLLLIYFGTMVALSIVNFATLRLCRIKANRTELGLLTAYTAVINFFGPLQSGPAVRALYLKKKYSLDLKKYAWASIVYYLFWAIYSGIFLLSGLLKWWLVPLSVLGLVVLFFIARHPRVAPKLKQLDMRAWYYIALATLLQIALITLIYYLELKQVAPATRLSQAIIYTGAANFALFVSITPGALGFREAFLVFSHRLHHISNSTIVAANITDRAVYILLLIILAIFVVAVHAKNTLGVSKASA